MTDYADLIDSATWGFINDTLSHYADDACDQSVAAQRRMYDRMCVAFRQPVPAGVATQDDVIDAVPVRHYTRTDDPDQDNVILYFHGGGFVVGGLDSHDDVCAELCAGTGFAVVNVDYRLAPEHAAPAQSLDCLAVARAIAARDSRRIILVGDSAGGYLAADLSRHLRGGDVTIAGQVLIYPGLGGDTNQGSYVTHAKAPLLTTEDVLFYHEMVYPEGSSKGLEPLQETDFSGLPPTMVMAAACDPLCDDSVQYHAALMAAGVPCRLHVETGLVHGFLRARHSVPRAAQAFERIITACRDLALGAL